jgi:hypothetical protein
LINTDVQLFWANNENNEIVIIYDMKDEDRNNKYTCPVCDSEVKPVAIGGVRKDGKIAQVSSHFSHYDASKCNFESQIHFWFKNKILVNGDSFIIKTNVDNEYKCKEVLIEQSYDTEYGIYKPDLTIITECGKTIYFEMNYTNKKKVEDYIDKWLELGSPVVEVNIKMLMDASFNKTKYWFKALFYEGKCFNTKKNDLYYDTIGKHKENLLSNGIDITVKNKIEKLNWFWRDINLYKQSKLDDLGLISMFDLIEKDEKQFIFDIVKRLKCTKVYEDYLNKKTEILLKTVNKCLKTYNNGEYENIYAIDIQDVYKGKYIINKILTFKNIEDMALTEIIHVIDCEISEFNSHILANLTYWKDVKSYYAKANIICNSINNKYSKFNSDIIEGRNSDKYLFKITFDEFYKTRDVYILIKINSIEFGKEKSFIYPKEYVYINNICVDIMNDDETIFKFIHSNMKKEIKTFLKKQDKLPLSSKFKTEEVKEQIALKREENILLFNKVANNIINIFKENKDKIKEYKLDYDIDDDFKNTIYFKDYRDKEFIIYDSSSYFHNDNYVKVNKYKYTTDLNFIDINANEDSDIIIVETENSYKIRSYINVPNYNFDKYFNKDCINLTFKNINKNCLNLPRYDFIKVKKELDKILKIVKSFTNDYVDNFYKSYNKEIYVERSITNDEINEQIRRLLYPMTYIANKSLDNKLNLILNISFTKEEGKLKPWLIKGFIESLENIGINNINNII